MDSVRAFALISLAACTSSAQADIPSTDGVATTDIGLTLATARSNGLVAQVVVLLTVNGKPASLGSGDSLVFHDSIGDKRALEDDGRIAGGELEAELLTGDINLGVDFLRGSIVDRSLGIELPPAFTLAASTALSRSNDVTITWSPSPDIAVDVVATGAPCLPDAGFTTHLIVDTGAVTLQPADFLNVGGACAVTIVVTRSEQGALQIRTLPIETTP